jgi:hypothetical protein
LFLFTLWYRCVDVDIGTPVWNQISGYSFKLDYRLLFLKSVPRLFPSSATDLFGFSFFRYRRERKFSRFFFSFCGISYSYSSIRTFFPDLYWMFFFFVCEESAYDWATHVHYMNHRPEMTTDERLTVLLVRLLFCVFSAVANF